MQVASHVSATLCNWAADALHGGCGGPVVRLPDGHVYALWPRLWVAFPVMTISHMQLRHKVGCCMQITLKPSVASITFSQAGRNADMHADQQWPYSLQGHAPKNESISSLYTMRPEA